MANFAYAAKARGGQTLVGSLQGASVDEVAGRLQADGLVVLSVTEAVEEEQERSFAGRFLAGITSMRRKTKTRDLALFTRQLATVLDAGIPLVRGLRGLACDKMSPTLSLAISDVANRIERGSSLAEALETHPEVFKPMYTSMIRAGETAGTLDEILDDLAVYLERSDAIQAKIRGALSYPIFILIFALSATAFMLLRLVPTFAAIYEDMGQKLPMLTRIVMGISDAVRENFAISLLVLTIMVVLAVMGSRTTRGRLAIDGFLISMPVFGPVIRKSVMSRFARTLGILLRSGLPILEALRLVRNAVGNVVVAAAIESTIEKIGAGQAITTALRSTRVVPEMILQLVSTGEESGELDAMLIKASDFYDRQVEASVDGINALIEPVMIVFVGAVIGVIVVAMFLPIFKMGDAVMNGGFGS
jgi:type IV pilus assembly protein PilC